MIIVNEEISNENSIELDSGFLLGKALFETILLKDKPIFFKEHLQRINKGLLKIGLKTQVSEEYFINNISKVGWKNCAVRLTVSEKNIIFTKREIGYKEKDYISGFKTKLSHIYRNPKSHFTYLKSVNYIDNLIEREKAINEGYNEVIFLNYEKYLSEGSVSNLFWIKNKKIYTPSLECGLLDGVVRKWVVSNFEVCEGKFQLNDLLNSDGAFFTNSLMGVMKVERVNEKLLKKSDIINDIRLTYEDYIAKL